MVAGANSCNGIQTKHIVLHSHVLKGKSCLPGVSMREDVGGGTQGAGVKRMLMVAGANSSNGIQTKHIVLHSHVLKGKSCLPGVCVREDEYGATQVEVKRRSRIVL